ncbi:MAG: PepSY domain-containing protein [Fimbriimonadaceae bacterium]|nr:PepSY domain-containing protein [Fimbriimonadaceae bacterium]QYK56942.1 MAG: PepSY domain-containing protein [Fimbriimonadaceae bacterium]
MFRRLRTLHKWVGLVCSLFLALISATGFLLAIKAKLDWVRPPTMSGGEVQSLSEVVSVQKAVDAVVALGHPEIQSIDDLDRFEYHADKNVYKLISKDNYLEAQVCGLTADVLSTGRRNDQLLEDIHDMSFFSEGANEWLLPVVAAGLFVLSVSGIVIFAVPIFRRIKFERQRPGRAAPGA